MKYTFEHREIFGKPYLKMFIRDITCEEVKERIEILDSIKTVNITESKSISHPGKTLTIYPRDCYSLQEVETDIRSRLEKYSANVKEVVTEKVNVAKFTNLEHDLLNELEKAQAIIIVCVAWFTNPILKEKLIEKLNDGCDVRVIINDDGINKKHSVDLTELPHIKVKGGRKGIMHKKYCVIDNNVVIEGSYNWTTNAEHRNEEEFTIHRNDVDLASQFTKDFNSIWKRAK